MFHFPEKTTEIDELMQALLINIEYSIKTLGAFNLEVGLQFLI